MYLLLSVVEFGFSFADPMNSGTVTECGDEKLVARLSFVTNVRIAPLKILHNLLSNK